MTDSPSLVVVAGPTAVGKTQLAIELAQRFSAELIGADSVQVYRGFNIGSSKPTQEELGGVVHHLIDVREPTAPLDAAGFAQLADRAIADVAGRGKLPIVVGGTGLWLRALLRGLVSVPPVDVALRARLERDWDLDAGQALYARLQEVDPLSAARIHGNDKLRVVRALEVYEQTGSPMGSLRQSHALGQPRYRFRLYVLDLPPAIHRELVAVRVKRMLAAGFAQEVAGLLAKYGSEPRAFGSVGYKQMLAHLTQGTPIAETEAAIVRATLIYARRQRTWWSTDPSVTARLTPDALQTPQLQAEIAEFADRAAR